MKHKKLFCIALSSVIAFSMIAFSACDKDEKPDDSGKTPEGPGQTTQATLLPTEKYTLPTEDDEANRLKSKEVAVHDPSVFYDEASETYYAFGSHFMVASSKDLIEWTQEVGDGSSEATGKVVSQKLYGDGVDWRTVLSESVKYAGRGMPSTWAPDVNFHNGKYYMYYSLTSGFGSNKSVIGRVSSDNVLGPYANEEVLITSGETGGPNAIDPELFTDKNGGLWMVYGSHFAGIYVKELYNDGENWGLPKEEGYGQLVWKGGDEVVEGPFVFYNDLTDYYYLMTTYGDLNFSYNMRIARSKNPNGPYTDITGADLATIPADGRAYGNKVAGSFKFENAYDQGYAAMGHNSVVKDKDGRYFVVYHARRQTNFKADNKDDSGVTPGHHLFVSELYFNEQGWPVMAPTPYVGERAGLVTQSEAAGDYKIIVHTTGTTAAPATSTTYTLSADGKITLGTEEKGTWKVTSDYYVEIVLDGITYNGVMTTGWDVYRCFDEDTAVLGITAVSNLTEQKQGGSLWGICAKS